MSATKTVCSVAPGDIFFYEFFFRNDFLNFSITMFQGKELYRNILGKNT